MKLYYFHLKNSTNLFIRKNKSTRLKFSPSVLYESNLGFGQQHTKEQFFFFFKWFNLQAVS